MLIAFFVHFYNCHHKLVMCYYYSSCCIHKTLCYPTRCFDHTELPSLDMTQNHTHNVANCPAELRGLSNRQTLQEDSELTFSQKLWLTSFVLLGKTFQITGTAIWVTVYCTINSIRNEKKCWSLVQRIQCLGFTHLRSIRICHSLRFASTSSVCTYTKYCVLLCNSYISKILTHG